MIINVYNLSTFRERKENYEKWSLEKPEKF